MNRNRAVELWVGLFVLAALGALVFLALKAANAASFRTGPSYALTARFTNIGGLKVRAPVRSAGVAVGRVTGISFDPQTFEAVVSFNIDLRYPFPKDTSAQILTAGLLGEQYIGLTAGGDTADLKQGDVIQITQSAVILENLIGQFLYGKVAEGGGTQGAAGSASSDDPPPAKPSSPGLALGAGKNGAGQKK